MSVSVGQLLKESILAPFKYWREFIRSFGIFLILFILISVGTNIFGINGQYSVSEIGLGGFILFLAFLTLFFAILISSLVRWDRFLILGEEYSGLSSIIGFKKRELGYLGRFLILVLASIPVLIAIFAVSFVLGLAVPEGLLISQFIPFILFILFTVFVSSRWSLMLAARAVDHEIYISGAWAISQGSGWKIAGVFGSLLGLTILFSVIPLFSALLFIGASGETVESTGLVIVTLFSQIMSAIFQLAMITVIALVYRDLKKTAVERGYFA